MFEECHLIFLNGCLHCKSFKLKVIADELYCQMLVPFYSPPLGDNHEFLRPLVLALKEED